MPMKLEKGRNEREMDRRDCRTRNLRNQRFRLDCFSVFDPDDKMAF